MSETAPSIPRIELAYAPTPLLHLERLSRELVVELWLKRDDLTGLLESGNKIRKLEFLVGEALAQGADALITCGTLQSNCCRTVAAVSARLGLRAILALKGRPSGEYDGNLLLDRLLGAEIRYCTDEEWEKVDQVLEELAGRVRAEGGTPYVIPESGATVTGALGYLMCGEELTQQIKHGAPDFDTVVITTFSGGSQAGLLMAKETAGLKAQVYGIPIAWDAARVRDHVLDLIDQARHRYHLTLTAPREVPLIDGYQGAGRATVGTETLETVARIARTEGIILDPVYTGKAFAALLDRIRRDPRELGPRVCFIHTGGVFSLFPFRTALTRLLDGDPLVES